MLYFCLLFKVVFACFLLKSEKDKFFQGCKLEVNWSGHLTFHNSYIYFNQDCLFKVLEILENWERKNKPTCGHKCDRWD